MTFILRFASLLFWSAASFAALANAFAPHEANAPLFTVQGSNTIGAKLFDRLLHGYFESEGATAIRTVPLGVENEYRVEARLGTRTLFVDVAAHGSSTGFRALLSGDATIAMSSRRIKPSEVQRLSGLGDLQSYASEHIIGIDGVAIIVHPRNPVASLTLDQLAKIFSGEISDWREVGGLGGEINLYARDANSGTWDTFDSLVLSDARRLSANAARFESNDQLSDLVSQDSKGIGFVGLASVRDAKVLAIAEPQTEALRPDVLAVATEDYALSRRLFLYTAENLPNESIRDFLAFIQSDAGQDIVNETGFVSQNLVSVKHEGPVMGPESYVELLENGQRLSVNFRFAPGSAELDNKAKRDVQRIVEFINRPENQSKRLLLVGFDDGEQSERRALVLSKLRATAVKSQLFKYGVISEPVIGLGDYLPVANNKNYGREKNRRVEVWTVERDPRH